jgi:hypothetical protein
VRRSLSVGALLLAFAGAIGGACALLDDDPPDGKCQSDQDCFRAQGEVCNLMKHECQPGGDGGVVDAP